MAAESPRDFQMVLFPPVMLVFFLGGGRADRPRDRPRGGANLGWLFAATAVWLLPDLRVAALVVSPAPDVHRPPGSSAGCAATTPCTTTSRA